MALNVEGGAGAGAGLRPGRPAASNGGSGPGPRRSPQARSQAERSRSKREGGTSRVIVKLKPGWDVSGDVTKLGGKLGRRLGLINGQVVELPNRLLRKLADYPAVERIVWDRPLDCDDEPCVGHRRRARRPGDARLHGRRHRRRGHRLGHHDLARRPHLQRPIDAWSR